VLHGAKTKGNNDDAETEKTTAGGQTELAKDDDAPDGPTLTKVATQDNQEGAEEESAAKSNIKSDDNAPDKDFGGAKKARGAQTTRTEEEDGANDNTQKLRAGASAKTDTKDDDEGEEDATVKSPLKGDANTPKENSNAAKKATGVQPKRRDGQDGAVDDGPNPAAVPRPKRATKDDGQDEGAADPDPKGRSNEDEAGPPPRTEIDTADKPVEGVPIPRLQLADEAAEPPHKIKIPPREAPPDSDDDADEPARPLVVGAPRPQLLAVERKRPVSFHRLFRSQAAALALCALLIAVLAHSSVPPRRLP
jgi:hypothetical protein